MNKDLYYERDKFYIIFILFYFSLVIKYGFFNFFRKGYIGKRYISLI